MGKAIRLRLDPVRRRQQQLRALSCAAMGLFASAAALVICVLIRWLGGWQPPATFLWLLTIGGPALGYAIGALWRRDWRDAAIAGDACYGPNDRILTALDFLGRPIVTRVQRLAVDDAIEHLDRVDAHKVVPSDTPRLLPCAVAAFAAALLLLLFTAPPKLNASPELALPAIVD